MAACGTAPADAKLPYGQRHIIRNNDDIIKRQPVIPHRGFYSLAAKVHICLRLYEQDLLAAKLCQRGQGIEFCTVNFNPGFYCGSIRSHKAGIVPRIFIS
jgi:hypothetical protein